MKRFKARISMTLAAVLIFTMSTVGSNSLAVPTMDEINSLKAEAAEISAEKSALEQKIADTEDEKQSILSKVSAMDEQIALTVEEINNINSQITLYEKLIDEKQKEVVDAQKKENEQLEKYRERVRAMEEYGSISYFAVIFDAASFSDLLARLDFIFGIMNYDEELYHAYIEAKEETQQAKAALEETKTEFEETKKELEEKQSELEQRREESNAYITELESTVEGYEALRAEASAAEAELWEQVNKLLAEYEAAQKKDDNNESDNGDLSDDNTDGDYDSEPNDSDNDTPSVTGQFIWPAPASYIITSDYGGRIHPIYGYWKEHAGIDIGAYRGSNIIAADGGTVITAYEHSSYGNFAMIDHGNGYITLYAHMDKLLVSAGDVVSQGEVLGLCGDTGLANGPHLHFEVYYDGVLQDPLDYLSEYPYEIWE